MRGALRASARRLADEQGGWTLAELLVATVLALMVIGSATTVFTSTIRNQPRQTSRATDVDKARTTMERITRELRQGWSVPTATPSELAILTYVDSATCGGAPANTAMACRVTYTCTTTSCSRVEANPDGTGPGAAEEVASGFSGPSAFTYSPSTTDPSYVGIVLSYPAADGDDSITLEDGVALRNPGAPPS